MRSTRAAMPLARVAPKWSGASAKRVRASMPAFKRRAARAPVAPSSPSSRRKATTSSFDGAPAGAPQSDPGPGEVVTPAGSAVPVDERRQFVDRRRRVRIRSPHNETFLEGLADFARRVYKKADQDQLFFMAGA